MVDLTNEQIIINRFGGSEKKLTMRYDNKIYMIKFPDPIRENDNDLSYMNNTYSEHVGSQIFKRLGFRTQETFLAKYKDKIVVACEDFTQDGSKLIEFSKLVLSDLDSPRVSRKSIPIEVMQKAVRNTNLLTEEQKKDFWKFFWRMFIVDIIIANQDRHLDNFGFLERNGSLEIAPVYDCGSSLDALYSDEKLRKLLRDPAEFKNAEYNIKSVFSYEDKRIFCFQFLSTHEIRELDAALEYILNKDLIFDDLIHDTPMNSVRKFYLMKAIKYRIDELKEIKR